MSLAQPQHPPERRPSPGFTVNVPTNNPFRKGSNSPSLNSPSLQPERPPSRNPFLDQPVVMSPFDAPKLSQSPPKSTYGAVPSTRETGEFLKSMSISDRPTKNENMPPQVKNGHRTTRSQEEEQEKSGRKVRGLEDTLDIFADPPPARRPPGQHRPRRNSDSSVADRQSKSLDPEDEKRRRERRHRDRAHRQVDSKGRPIPSASSKSKKPNHRLDVIDKLDVTSIFGTGAFHHDGPFDACNPHRNRKGASRAPMQAFPKDSANNMIGGSGPVNKSLDLAKYHGHVEDGFADFNNTVVTKDSQMPTYDSYSGPINGTNNNVQYRGDARPAVNRTSTFEASAKAKKLHGDESLGLGTSTFLEGAPAPRVAIERRESEEDTNGLTRKRSLAQKIRSINNVRAPRAQGVYSPEPRHERAGSMEGVQSAGGLPKITETNPFFQDYDEEYDKKGASIRVAEERLAGEGEASGSRPADTLRRTVTDGSAGMDGDDKGGSGFLSRVKSLRGGKRARPERRE